jgi:hypothetical protein
MSLLSTWCLKCFNSWYTSDILWLSLVFLLHCIAKLSPAIVTNATPNGPFPKMSLPCSCGDPLFGAFAQRFMPAQHDRSIYAVVQLVLGPLPQNRLWCVVCIRSESRNSCAVCLWLGWISRCAQRANIFTALTVDLIDLNQLRTLTTTQEFSRRLYGKPY